MHYVNVCKHGIVMGQCRCPGPKTERIVPCRESCSEPEVASSERMCDHICLKPYDHVEKGEPHFYGYELPSPRLAKNLLTQIEDLLAYAHLEWSDEAHWVKTLTTEQKNLLADLIDAGHARTAALDNVDPIVFNRWWNER